jgi:predicted ATP-grasp superfamily ATP-dependent carboligase
MDSRPSVLIVAAAGRALAASAYRAGYAPLVADYFGDQDTLAVAAAHVRLEGGLAQGMREAEVLGALGRLANRSNTVGVVYGSGFEDRPAILEQVAQRWRLLGNVAETVVRAKDPTVVADLCGTCGIPHPDISREHPVDQSDWLVKRTGGAGGTHVRPASGQGICDATSYFQRRRSGLPVSVLILSDGGRAAVRGLSSQWSAPTADRPFRYGGAVQPAMIGPAVATTISDAAVRITLALRLVGLNSVDFLVDGDAFCLLEINPRPGATLDVFERGDMSLFGLHVAACGGALTADLPVEDDASAAAIVYAAHDIPWVPAFDWPDWTADRQGVGTSVMAGQPLCTVLASANTSMKARTLLDRRVATIVARTRAWVS